MLVYIVKVRIGEPVISSLLVQKFVPRLLLQELPQRHILLFVVLIRLGQYHPKIDPVKINALQYGKFCSLDVQAEEIEISDARGVLFKQTVQRVTFYLPHLRIVLERYVPPPLISEGR